MDHLRTVDPSRQLDAARRAVLAVPRPDLAVFAVTGADRVSWLNGLLTCDLVRRAPGDAAYGLAVARNGRVLADVIVVDDPAGARLLVAVPSGAAAGLAAHLDHYLVMEDAALTPAEFDVWELHGPRAVEVLGGVRGAPVAADAAGVDGIDGVAGALDRTGLGGGVVLVARVAGVDARRPSVALEAAVVAAGGVVGDEAGWEALRLERAVPRFGADFDERTYPQEASLEKTAVRFDKGCYLGQEVVCMLEMRGHVKRKLVPLIIDGASAPPPGEAVVDEDGTAVGEVTSAQLSPTLGRPVAFAMLKRAYAEPGRALTIGGAGAKVVDRPA